MASKPKVLFVAGWGRSGSTLVSRLLGQVEGFASVGELNTIWENGIRSNRVCGCSLPFRQCPFWSQAASSFLEMSSVDLRRILDARNRLRLRNCWQLLTKAGVQRARSRAEEYSLYLAELYQGILEASGCRVIVDSSKFSSHGLAAQGVDHVDFHVLHLVRDARAVAFSWTRRKVYEVGRRAPRYMRKRGTLEASLSWLIWNLLPEVIWGRDGEQRYLRMRYEDFVLDPRHAFERIAILLNEPIETRFLSGSDRAMALPSHIVAGNPSRFRTGEIEIRLDDEWRSALSPVKRAVITWLTFPLLRRYGYL